MEPRRFFVGRAIGLVIVIVVVLLIAGFSWLNTYIYQQKQGPGGSQQSYKDSTYLVEGKPVTLTNGESEAEAAPGSASSVVTKIFGNEAEGDLNGDGVSDIAFVLTQSAGGSGTFYYVVAGLKGDTGYTGTNAVLLGDRIAPQTTQIKDGELIVNYADRSPGEPMSAPPSVGVSKYLKVEGGALVEVQQ
jgi:hypothetical protein